MQCILGNIAFHIQHTINYQAHHLLAYLISLHGGRKGVSCHQGMGANWATIRTRTHTHTHTHSLSLSLSLFPDLSCLPPAPNDALAASPRRAWFQCSSTSNRIPQRYGACRRVHASRGGVMSFGYQRAALLTERHIELLIGVGTWALSCRTCLIA
ncbi:hypothetical protein LZ30DRAFT_99447 [Colletotrichum cereale]|nr:hypothetical protein LZ30DRAFT_99447 [Colletotrichum cereale]